MNPWLIGGGAVALLLLAGGKAQARFIGQSPRERDLDALANMLITETGFNKSREEMAQIVYVAINRAKRQGKPIWFVVQPGSDPRPVWNTGAIYRKRFEEARDNPRWLAARNFASQVLSGAYRNLGVTAFVHPKPMPSPPCASNRVATSTSYGTRCLPKWIVDGRQIGTAWFA